MELVADIHKDDRGMDSAFSELIREERGVPFLIDDGTGRAIVDPDAAKVALDVDARSHSGAFDAPNERESAFLQRHGESGKGDPPTRIRMTSSPRFPLVISDSPDTTP